MNTPGGESAIPNLARAGARLGARVSVLAVLVYSSAVAVCVHAVPSIRALPVPYVPGLIDDVAVLAGDIRSTALFFIGFGTLPALIIGVATGWVIGMVLQHNWTLNTPGGAWLLGMTICVVFTLLLNVGWLSFFTGSSAQDGQIFAEPYGLLLGMPSLIYILLGGCAGARLYSTQECFTHQRERMSQETLSGAPIACSIGLAETPHGGSP